MTDRAFKTFIEKDDKYRYIDYIPKHIIAGDTDSGYFDLSCKFDRESDINEVIKFADEIGDITNKAFPKFMEEVFNVEGDRAKVIETEREVVADKSYFLGKKMYVMHLVNSEGIEVDKLKMMGVAIKRSDTPKIVQDFLKKIVNMIMEQNDFETVNNYINEFKDNYKSIDLVEIGRPITLKSLAKYEHIYNKSKLMKNFPYHVRAALYYNSMCSDKDIKIQSGDKARIIYINHPTFNYIAIPVDVEEYPEFVDNFVIDWQTQWETVQKKVNIFLKPIGYDLESRQESLSRSLVEF